MTQLVWFRNDLRTTDNPALTAACQGNEPVLACYIATPGQWREHHWSAIRMQFVADHVDVLAHRLGALGIPLAILYADRFDDSIATLKEFCYSHNIQTLHLNAEYGFNERQRDRRVKEQLTNITVHKYADQCVAPVKTILTGQDTPYTVFTPFYRRWSAWLSDTFPQPYPEPKPRGPQTVAQGVNPERLGINESPAHRLPIGETAALNRLSHFLAGGAGNYAKRRDFPAVDGTSRLSPYLANGVLSGRQCWAACQSLGAGAISQEGIATWIKELAWRDFYIHILYHFPRVSRDRAFQPATEALQWNPPGDAFEAWKAGQTGIPIVDAAMRQLNQTGWMHNRLRMISAMFLTKNLFIDWRLGERYFMSRLVDGFLASNNGGWQWSASTGTDAAPYFRVFNPVSQSEKFDPDGDFIRHYVPELAALDNKRIHLPGKGGPIPTGYSSPLVDLKESRKEAIARFQALKEH